MTAVKHYETSGLLRRPLVTLHTTGDPVIPYWHEPRYDAKTSLTGSRAELTQFPAFRYNHCNFTTGGGAVVFRSAAASRREPASGPQSEDGRPAGQRGPTAETERDRADRTWTALGLEPTPGGLTDPLYSSRTVLKG